MAEVRAHNNEDTRRDLAVEMFKRQVRAAGIGTDYDADIEHMEHALIAFADEWSGRLRERISLLELALTGPDPKDPRWSWLSAASEALREMAQTDVEDPSALYECADELDAIHGHAKSLFDERGLTDG